MSELSDKDCEEQLLAYHRQQRVLRWFKNVPPFVTACLPGTEKNGRSCTYAVWENGVRIALPKADWLVFVDMTVKPNRYLQPVRWAAAQAIIGHRMGHVAFVPPRHLVDSFPDDAEIARLAKAAEPDGLYFSGEKRGDWMIPTNDEGWDDFVQGFMQ